MPHNITHPVVIGKTVQTHISAKLLDEHALMSHHLVCAAGPPKPEGVGNHCNGTSAKILLTDTGAVLIQVPRECDKLNVPVSQNKSLVEPAEGGGFSGSPWSARTLMPVRLGKAAGSPTSSPYH